MDDNDKNIQKYLIWFDEEEKSSLTDDDESWIFSDSDNENSMDPDEVSTQPNANSGFEYVAEPTSFNLTTASFQYSGNVSPTYTNSETIVESSPTTDYKTMPGHQEYDSNKFLAPQNFYGNSTYVSTQHYQKIDEESVGCGQYNQEVSGVDNEYSNGENNESHVVEPQQETVVETKTEIVDEREEVIDVTAEQCKEDTEPVPSAETKEPEGAYDETVNHKTENAEADEQTSNETDNQSSSQSNKSAEVEIANVQMCIRSGCANQAINNPEWEQEFCSNDCVIIHCKNVFTAWVKSNEVATQ